MNEYEKLFKDMMAITIARCNFTPDQRRRYEDECHRLFYYIWRTQHKRTVKKNKKLIRTNCTKNAVSHAFKKLKKDKETNTLNEDFNPEVAAGFELPETNPEKIIILTKEAIKKSQICSEQRKLFNQFYDNLPKEKKYILITRFRRKKAQVPYRVIAKTIKKEITTARYHFWQIIQNLRDFYIEMDKMPKAEAVAEVIS